MYKHGVNLVQMPPFEMSKENRVIGDVAESTPFQQVARLLGHWLCTIHGQGDIFIGNGDHGNAMLA